MTEPSTLLVTGGRVAAPGPAATRDVVISGGRIAAEASVRADVQLDATGCFVLPGFIDLQVNGAVGVDLTTEPRRIGEVAEFLPRCGVTSFMPTVISSSPDRTLQALHTIGTRQRSTAPGRARSLGVHLEGPFLNPRRVGAHPPQHLRLPSAAEVGAWLDPGLGAGLGMVTLAPELPGATDVIRLLVAAGVTVSVGHTEVDGAGLADAVAAGGRGATHLFNAMGSMSARHPGPAGAVLARDDVWAGIIADGLHVDPTMVDLAWRLLGPDRLVLVTDAMSALGLPGGDHSIGDTAVRVDERGARTASGALAGSVLRFDEAIRNLIAWTGCSLSAASAAASANPARLIGRDDIGRLDPGMMGDLVLLDPQLDVVATVIGGRVVFDPQQRCAPTRVSILARREA